MAEVGSGSYNSQSGFVAWAMVSDRAGDRAQAEAVARATGWPYAVKEIVPRGGSRHHRPPRGYDPACLDPMRSSPLNAPWPEFIIAIGLWAVRAAFWVRERSQGRTKIILLGRPRPRELDEVDLVVCPSQYRLPRHPKVVHLDFPPLRADHRLVERAREDWGRCLAALPRPLTAVLVGGQTKPFQLDATVACKLAEDLCDIRRRDGGLLYVATSPRSGPDLGPALHRELGADALLFDWARDPPAANPYNALLACADRFVVTGDSMSMLVEVASLGRPLAIYPLPRIGQSIQRFSHALRMALFRNQSAAWRQTLALAVHRSGLIGFPRDLEALHAKLIEGGHAVLFGCPFPTAPRALPDELPPLIARLQALRGGDSVLSQALPEMPSGAVDRCSMFSAGRP